MPSGFKAVSVSTLDQVKSALDLAASILGDGDLFPNGRQNTDRILAALEALK
jgi:hypothetical protein